MPSLSDYNVYAAFSEANLLEKLKGNYYFSFKGHLFLSQIPPNVHTVVAQDMKRLEQRLIKLCFQVIFLEYINSWMFFGSENM